MGYRLFYSNGDNYTVVVGGYFKVQIRWKKQKGVKGSVCVIPGLSDCWVWRHWLPGTGGDRWEDIAHANLDISFALTAAER